MSIYREFFPVTCTLVRETLRRAGGLSEEKRDGGTTSRGKESLCDRREKDRERGKRRVRHERWEGLVSKGISGWGALTARRSRPFHGSTGGYASLHTFTLVDVCVCL